MSKVTNIAAWFTESRWGGRTAYGLAAAGLLLLSWVILSPTLDNWFHFDDFHNIRWALEYREAPWRALFYRHAMHDHIRPMTLMTLWLGLAIGDGAFVHIQLVFIALVLGGLFGLARLSRDLAGTPWAAPLALLFVLSLPGFQLLPTWQAWMCTAGEICFGLWALVAFRRDLAAGRWGLLSCGLVVIAGLYKEPGWIVYPTVAATLTFARWRASPSELRGGLRALSPLILAGVLGMIYSWNPANVVRYSDGQQTIGARVLDFLATWPGRTLDGFPTWTAVNEHTYGPGIPVFLVVAALVGDLVGSRRLREPLWTLIWMAVTVSLSVVGLVGRAPASAVLVALAAAVWLRRWQDPPLGLSLFLVGFGLLSPVPNPNDVQPLIGGYGLALYLSATLLSLPGQLRPGYRTPAVIAGALGIALTAGHTLVIAKGAPKAEIVALWSKDRDGFLDLGGVSEVLGGAHYITLGNAGDLSDEILEMVGATHTTLKTDRVGAVGSATATALVGPKTGLTNDGTQIAATLTAQNLLTPTNLRWLDGTLQSGWIGENITLSAGSYLLGLLNPNSQMRDQLMLALRDGCGKESYAKVSMLPGTVARLNIVNVKAGCERAQVAWADSFRPVGLTPVLVRLPVPKLSFWNAKVARTLDVRAVDTGNNAALQRTSGR